VSNAPALILELRNNPGGDLATLVEVAGRFIDGPAWREVRADGTETDHAAQNTAGKALPGKVRLVVLANAGTAGTAEMLAGALRDRRQARIIGTPSFGRGTVQSAWSLDDGSWLRMTTAEWRTPSGTPVDGVGLTPDESVDGAEAQTAAAERAAEAVRGG
jgi:carboxyl-terminal processing protease